MPQPRLFALFALSSLFFSLSSAHDGHDHAQSPLDPTEKDWATRHMRSEHHISNFDAQSFFQLHDYDSDGFWEDHEIRRTYGLENDDSYMDGEGAKKAISEEQKETVAKKVLEMFDLDHDGLIDVDEWMEASLSGKHLPDFGYGPGHHGDDEYEYEIHHWERYHNEDSPEEEFHHDEDRRHFERHDARHRDEDSQAVLDKLPIIEANIPAKFRRF